MFVTMTSLQIIIARKLTFSWAWG